MEELRVVKEEDSSFPCKDKKDGSSQVEKPKEENELASGRVEEKIRKIHIGFQIFEHNIRKSTCCLLQV